MTNTRLAMWGFLLLGAAGIVACGGGGGGGSDPGASLIHPLDRRGQNCSECHATWDFAAIHRSDHSSYDPDCLKCHGTMLDEKTLDSSVVGPHTAMIPRFLGVADEGKPSNATCTGCHATTDLAEHSAADLRRQVYVSWCWGCHKASGPNPPALYPD